MRTINKRKHRKFLFTGMHIIIGNKPFFYLQAMFLVKVQRRKNIENGFKIV